MKKCIPILLLLYCCCLCVHGMPGDANAPQPERTSYRAFKENKGQVTDQSGTSRSDIHFQLSTGSTSVFIGPGTIHYQWNQEADNNQAIDSAVFHSPAAYNTYRLDVKLIGANPEARLVKENIMPDIDIYYAGGLDGARVHSFRKITYQNIYPDIDWVLYVKDGLLKYDFIVHPGGKVSDINIQYNGGSKIEMEHNGALTVQTPLGSLKEQAPFSYNAATGQEVSSHFSLENNIVRFEVAPYEGTLVIDPELRLDWATYYGGMGAEYAQHLDYSFQGYYSHTNTVTTDFEGMIYMSGTTISIDNIATTGAFQTTLSNNGSNAFLVKFNPEGQRIWATYFGGQGGVINPDDGLHHGTVSGRSHSVACDTLGNIYMAGITWSSSGISTPGAYQTGLNGVNGWPDLYLVKFHSDGVREWATYFGNIMDDEGGSLAVTPDGSKIYLAGASKSGTTTNDTIVTPGALFPALPAHWSQYTGFLACFNALGQKQWGSYLADVMWVDCTVNDIAMDGQGNLLLTGYVTPRPGDTNSIATAGTFQSQYSGGIDAFLQKWDGAGNRLWGTYFGGSKMDIGYGVTCGDHDDIYIAGITASTTGPQSGIWSVASPGSFLPAKPDPSDFDNFLAKFSGSGQRVWGTYYGGTNPNAMNLVIGHRGGALAFHDNKLFMLYTTLADSMATPCAYKVTNPGIYNNNTSYEAHLAIFDTSGNREYATYYGGLQTDLGLSVAIDSTADGVAVYLAGITYSPTGIATMAGFKNTIDPQLSIQRDAFLAKFIMPVTKKIVVPCFTLDSVQIKAGDTTGYNYQWTDGAATSYTWIKTSGTYIVNYQKANGCPTADTFLVDIYPMPLLAYDKMCVGQGEARITVQEGNSNVYTYKWHEASGSIISETQSDHGAMLAGLQPGNYTLQILAAGCDTTLSFTIDALPQVSVTISNDTLITAGSSVQLWATGASFYKWEPEQWLDNPHIARPVAKPEAPVTYTVTGYNEHGCKAAMSVYIDINGALFIPNAFSPNGDGLNDEFGVGNLGYHKLIAFRVFNRWGTEVFFTTNPKQGWNGNYNGKQADLGVYHYYISIFDTHGKEQMFKGDVTLIR